MNLKILTPGMVVWSVFSVRLHKAKPEWLVQESKDEPGFLISSRGEQSLGCQSVLQWLLFHVTKFFILSLKTNKQNHKNSDSFYYCSTNQKIGVA